MTLGMGIAIAGIWIGVGLVGLKDKGGWSILVAICAFLATLATTASLLK